MKYNISFVWIWKVISCSLATGKYMEEGYFVMWFDFEEIWEKDRFLYCGVLYHEIIWNL